MLQLSQVFAKKLCVDGESVAQTCHQSSLGSVAALVQVRAYYVCCVLCIVCMCVTVLVLCV